MIGASKASTVWRQVATGGRWLRALRSHPLPSGGAVRVKPPPSGDRWLRATRWLRALFSHPLPSGGAVRVKPPPSGDRWLRRTGGYGRQVDTGDRWIRAVSLRNLNPKVTHSKRKLHDFDLIKFRP